MDEREFPGRNILHISGAMKGNLFLAASIVLVAAAALVFGRIDEGISQIVMFAFLGAVAIEFFVLRSYATKGKYQKLRNDTVGILIIEAIYCFLMSGALIYAASLMLATFVPASNILKSSSGSAAVISSVAEVVSLATSGAVPVSAAAKVADFISGLVTRYGIEKSEMLLNIAVWAFIICLFIGMLIRVLSGILLICSANDLKKAFADPDGEADFSKTARCLIAAGIGIVVCSGVPAGGVALILSGRALKRSAEGPIEEIEENKDDSDSGPCLTEDTL